MIQIDMEMPSCCAECRLSSYAESECWAVDEYKDYDPDSKIRPDWCPLVEVLSAEPKKGKWIKADSQQYFRKHYPCFTCSACGYRKDSQKKWNFCPNCGSRMDG